MKLYPKKLSSLEELKREQEVLKYAKKHTEAEQWLNLNDLKPKLSKGGIDTGLLGTVLSAMGSKSIFGTVLTLAPTLLKLIPRWSGKNNFLKSFVTEVGGGYVKWKAVQLAFKTAKNAIRAIKHNKKEHL